MIDYLLNLDLNHYNSLKTGRWYLAIIPPPIHYNCRCVLKDINHD